MKVVILGLMMLVASMVNAGAYVGTQVATISDDDLSFNVVNVIAGLNVNEVVGVRARVMVQSSDDSIDGVSVDLDSAYGLDLVLTVPAEGFSPYFIVGRTKLEVTGSYGGYSESASDSFTTVGAGLNYPLNDSATLSIEYMRMDSDISLIGAGISFSL